MKIHSELDKAIAGAYASLREAILIIEAEKDSPDDDDQTFETASGFMSNLLEVSDLSMDLIKTKSVRMALEMIKEML